MNVPLTVAGERGGSPHRDGNLVHCVFLCRATDCSPRYDRAMLVVLRFLDTRGLGTGRGDKSVRQDVGRTLFEVLRKS